MKNKLTYVAEEVDLIDYYDNHIGPLAQKYADKTWKTVRVVVCPLHNDHDASLGLLIDKNNKKIQRYHCFGCGKSGNVIDLHRAIVKQRQNRTISLLEAADELAKLYNLDMTDISAEMNINLLNHYQNQNNHIEELLINRGRLNVRNYMKNFNKIVTALEDNYSLDVIAKSYDELNNKYKEVL